MGMDRYAILMILRITMHTAPSHSFNMCGREPFSFNDLRKSSQAPTPSPLSSFWFFHFITVTPVHVFCAGGCGIARICFSTRSLTLDTETLRAHSTADLQHCVDPVHARSGCA